MTANARFWITANEQPVKITLRPGQRLRWTRPGKDETQIQDFAHCEHWVTYAETLVRRVDGRRLVSHWDMECLMGKIRWGKRVDGMPDWTLTDQWDAVV